MFPLQLKPFIITQWNCTPISSCNARRRRRTGHLSQISSLQQQRPFFADAGIRHWNALAAGLDLSQRPACRLSHPLQPSGVDPKNLTKRESFTALLQMPRRNCKTCRYPLHADDTHAECVSCLGKSHTALSGTDCSHCENFSLASLRSQIAFFSESDFFLPGTYETKTAGRGFEQPVTSKLTSAQCPRTSPSPQREHSPVLFTQHDQRPSAAASDMISFGASDNKLDDSLSLAASYAEELFDSVTDPALLPSSASCNARLRADEELFRVTTKAVNELRLEWSPPEEPSRSRLDEWFLPGRHQALRQRSSPFLPEVHDEFTKS